MHIEDFGSCLLECHVTVDPVVSTTLDNAAAELGFRRAKLFKENAASQLDTFFTAHGTNFADLETRMNKLKDVMTSCGVNVRRMKIEAVLYDNRKVIQ